MKNISCIYRQGLVSAYVVRDESGATNYCNETVGTLFADCTPLITECTGSPNARHPGHWGDPCHKTLVIDQISRFERFGRETH